MSTDHIKEANDAYDAMSLYITKLIASGTHAEDPQLVNAERLRNNLAAAVGIGKANPKAAEVLLPSVLASVNEYLGNAKN